MKASFFLPILALLLWDCSMKNAAVAPQEVQKPNIVIFYVDDLGYADLRSYGAKGVETPHVDKLVKGGLKFNDAHSSSATCTPSRYSLLTGEHAFRNDAQILPGDAPLLIDTAKYTLPKMLREVGYTTGVVGKWHLGLGNGEVDWNGKVSPGPLEIGFDYSFLLPSTGDRVPTVYLENHSVLNLTDSDPLKVSYKDDLGQVRATKENARYASDGQHSETLVNGVGRIGAMTGGKSAYWKDEEFPDVLTSKAVSFIEKSKHQPFFLFFSFHDIHVPRLPNERFQGKTEMGPRGDAIVQMDWITGQVMNKLKELGLEKNTLVIFTSDNGPVLNDGYADMAEEKLGGHNPAGPYRGGKYSSFEAGTRVPHIVYWPKVVAPGETNALFSQLDYFASFAALTGAKLPSGVAPDSENQLSALLGNTKKAREVLLEESFTLALRQGKWKYIRPVDKSKKFPTWLANKNIESGLQYEPQLFDLERDINENINVANDFPEIVRQMEARLKEIENGIN